MSFELSARLSKRPLHYAVKSVKESDMREEFQQKLIFKVIVNEEDHYSLWLVDREDPPGWRDIGEMRASAMECLDYIEELYFRERLPEPAPVSSSISQAKPAPKAAYA